jgi:hypothetical protein
LTVNKSYAAITRDDDGHTDPEYNVLCRSSFNDRFCYKHYVGKIECVMSGDMSHHLFKISPKSLKFRSCDSTLQVADLTLSLSGVILTDTTRVNPVIF